MTRHYDLAVIGSGPAGHSAAIQARRLGARVAIVEKRYAAGGECVNTGTIPSKAMREAVLHLTGYRQRGFYGAGYTVKETITAEDLRRRTYQVVELESGVFDRQLRRSGVEVLRGEAFFLDSRRLGLEGCADTDEVRADSILVASGSTPARPASVPFDGAAVVDGVVAGVVGRAGRVGGTGEGAARPGVVGQPGGGHHAEGVEVGPDEPGGVAVDADAGGPQVGRRLLRR